MDDVRNCCDASSSGGDDGGGWICICTIKYRLVIMKNIVQTHISVFKVV